jgi:hypothetical protein
MILFKYIFLIQISIDREAHYVEYWGEGYVLVVALKIANVFDGVI